MPFKKSLNATLALSAMLLCGAITATAQTQTRPRVVKTSSSRPVNAPAPAAPVVVGTASRPANQPVSQPVVKATSQNIPAAQPVTARPPMMTNITVKASDRPVAPVAVTGKDPVWNAPVSPVIAALNQRLTSGIQARLGIRYVYGTEGPYTYDCSGFVWSVFQEAGIHFERSSARTYWNQFEAVEGADRFKFGTLVFLNGLGHMGIVADENGFYHASSSKGITYSPFAGYWGKRIVGYRRIPGAMLPK